MLCRASSCRFTYMLKTLACVGILARSEDVARFWFSWRVMSLGRVERQKKNVTFCACFFACFLLRPRKAWPDWHKGHIAHGLRSLRMHGAFFLFLVMLVGGGLGGKVAAPRLRLWFCSDVSEIADKLHGLQRVSSEVLGPVLY